MQATVRSSRLVILLVLAASPLVGCIGVQTNAAREFPTYPPESVSRGPATPVALTVTFTASGYAANDEIRRMQDVEIQQRLTELLDQTGTVRVSLNPGEAQYRLAVRVNDFGGGDGANFAKYVTYFTLFVIPSWLTHDYTTTAELSAPGGRIVAQKRHVHSLTMVRQLFMVFGMPFSSVDRAHARMWDAVLPDFAVWAAEQIEASR